MCVPQQLIVPFVARAALNLFLLNFFNGITVDGLKCYTDVDGKQITSCNELEGFRTCFTKYNDSKFHPSAFPFGIVQQYQEATVIGRGCSTKDKVFYRECETHSYGDSVEKMCFCSFMLCNSAPAASPEVRCANFVTVLALTAFWTIVYSLQTSGDLFLWSRPFKIYPDKKCTLCSSPHARGLCKHPRHRKRRRKRMIAHPHALSKTWGELRDSHQSSIALPKRQRLPTVVISDQGGAATRIQCNSCDFGSIVKPETASLVMKKTVRDCSWHCSAR